MADWVEGTGKTIEEATRQCLEKLGVPVEEADISVIEYPSRGIFGLGSKLARVRAVVKERRGAEKAKKITEKILSLMGLSCQTEVTEDDSVIRIDIETAGTDGLLIGKHGQTLRSFQYLVNRMMGHSGERKRVVLDVSGYRKRREEFLIAKAHSLASTVKSAGRRIKMTPLEADERRIVHLALQSDPEVKTYSIGQGRVKTVVVAPANESSGRRRTVGSTRSRGRQ